LYVGSYNSRASASLVSSGGASPRARRDTRRGISALGARNFGGDISRRRLRSADAVVAIADAATAWLACSTPSSAMRALFAAIRAARSASYEFSVDMRARGV
jgi:hypothetical protein